MNLSIIIPVYNCADYLNNGFKKLKPLYESTIAFEIIYVNDGSTDNSLAILKKIEAENSNVKVYTQINQGSSGARNTAIDVAVGEYIQFLDADDYLDVHQLIPLLKEAYEKKLDAISYRLNYVNDSDEVLSEREKQSVQHNQIITGREALIQGFNPSSICVFLFKTSFLNQNKLRITPKITHMDIEFTSRMMLCANRIEFKDVFVYNYLQRQGSITKPQTTLKLKQFLLDEIIVANLVKNTIDDYQISDKKLINAIRKNYNSIVWNLLYRLITKPKEVDFAFKNECVAKLKERKLYPVKGGLKSNFQRLTSFFFNNEFLLKKMLQR